MTCSFCTGSHYLSDNRDLGPCVCVTPEAMRDLEFRLQEATASAQVAQTRAETILGAADEHSLVTTDNAAKARLFDALYDAWDDYCVMQGAGANPPALPAYVRSHKPNFARLFDRMQEIRRRVEHD